MIRMAAPVYSIEISDAERDQAVKTRKAFADLIESMTEAFDNLGILANALDGITENTSFISMGKLFLRYKRKVQKLFNSFISKLQAALLNLNATASDSQMEKIKDTVVGEVREIRDGVLEILDLLDDPEEKTFAQDFTATVERLNERADSLEEVISDQLFEHIDTDILGKIRLGGIKDLPIKISSKNVPLFK